jgi:CrcB protein
MKFLLVVIGAAFGAPTRFLVDQRLRKFLKYPLSITVINVLGSFVIGMAVESGDKLQALIVVGFAGAFTTWSTFILDLYLAFELKQYKRTLTNLLLSLTLGLGAVWLGIHLVQ